MAIIIVEFKLLGKWENAFTKLEMYEHFLNSQKHLLQAHANLTTCSSLRIFSANILTYTMTAISEKASNNYSVHIKYLYTAISYGPQQRKPVFDVSDKVRLKPVSSATETS